VLPIGGLKEKTMAALRNGIKTVLIPADNVRDLEQIDQTVRAALEFVPVSNVDEVLSRTLCPAPARIKSRVEKKPEPQEQTPVAAFAPARENSGDALRQ
jgi:ATP-dependent Lon protease